MTQREMVRWHLENIGELKDEGMNIETEYRTVRNRFGKLVAHAVYKVAA